MIILIIYLVVTISRALISICLRQTLTYFFLFH